ncbi:MAG: serine/threonine-protein kinase, partial [Thermoanaerobaculia bacterium]
MDDSTQRTEPIAKPFPARGPAERYRPGDLVADRYRLSEPLGRGGFSQVFLAFDTKLDREVALKILRSLPSRDLPTLSDEQASRFLREARMVARLDHPHIVPVYDAGVEDGVPWIAMKRVLGEPLSQRLKAGPLPTGRAVRLLRQVGDALRHAHQRGITHRDLKPANLLVEVREGGSDHAWLTDFGIAILRDEVRPEGNLVVGTPGYMAPEQITGELVDERADLFALGCIAAELITGRRVFTGSTPHEVSAAVLQGDTDLGGLAERAGWRYAAAVRRCLARSPEERWQTVEVFAQALAEIGPEAAPSLLGRFRRARPASSWDGRFAVRTEGLTKGYRRRRPVIENLDLAIPRGSVYALLGRNGSGKTTLLRTLLGLYRRDRGRVEVFGKDPE